MWWSLNFNSLSLALKEYLLVSPYPSWTNLLWDRILHYIGKYTSVCSLQIDYNISLFCFRTRVYSVRNVSSMTVFGQRKFYRVLAERGIKTPLNNRFGSTFLLDSFLWTLKICIKHHLRNVIIMLISQFHIK